MKCVFETEFDHSISKHSRAKSLLSVGTVNGLLFGVNDGFVL